MTSNTIRKQSTIIQINFDVIVKNEDIDDIMVSALECGITYWFSKVLEDLQNVIYQAKQIDEWEKCIKKFGKYPNFNKSDNISKRRKSMSLTINRSYNNKPLHITLTEKELREAHILMERKFREQDIKATIANDTSNMYHITLEQLEHLPEILTWLVQRYDDFFDANITYNDIIKLVLNYYQNASLKKEFFKDLSNISDSTQNESYLLAYQAFYLHTKECSCSNCIVCKYIKKEIGIYEFLTVLKEESPVD